MRAATFVLLFAAALASSTAQQGDNDVALHALAASSRAALASATLSSRFPTFFAQGFLPLHSSHARRLLDSSDSNDNQGGDDMPSCATDLPCVQKLLQLQNNASAFSDVMAVTNASQCPTQPADADKCFYVRPQRCACASCACALLAPCLLTLRRVCPLTPLPSPGPNDGLLQRLLRLFRLFQAVRLVWLQQERPVIVWCAWRLQQRLPRPTARVAV